MPFAELLGFATRSLELAQIFVPMVNEGKARTIHHISDVGMHAGPPQISLKPKAIVIMGGLSMPNVPVRVEQVKEVIDMHKGALVIGICFMYMFEKAGWLSKIRFNCLIDANIDPVEVIKNT